MGEIVTLCCFLLQISATCIYILYSLWLGYKIIMEWDHKEHLILSLSLKKMNFFYLIKYYGFV